MKYSVLLPQPDGSELLIASGEADRDKRLWVRMHSPFVPVHARLPKAAGGLEIKAWAQSQVQSAFNTDRGLYISDLERLVVEPTGVNPLGGDTPL